MRPLHGLVKLNFAREDLKMEDLIEIINFANSQIKKAKETMTTYEDDATADHEDGRYSGTVTAYSEIIKKCAAAISARI